MEERRVEEKRGENGTLDRKSLLKREENFRRHQRECFEGRSQKKIFLNCEVEPYLSAGIESNERRENCGSFGSKDDPWELGQRRRRLVTNVKQTELNDEPFLNHSVGQFSHHGEKTITGAGQSHREMRLLSSARRSAQAAC